MMVKDLIEELKARLLIENNLATIVYYSINDKQDEIAQLDVSGYNGNIESVAIDGLLGRYADISKVRGAERILNNSGYKRYVNVFAIIGLHMQDVLNASDYFDKYVSRWFIEHSIVHKFLIARVCSGSFEDKLIRVLEGEIDSNDPFVLLLKFIYLQQSVNIARVISSLSATREGLGIIDLIILEDLQNIQATRYNKIQQELLNDILWCASEIQSKHRVLNNNEDQYNSNFQSLLKAKGYKTEPQTQRGESATQTSYGELDIAIFAENDMPLSIFEAYVINSIDKEYISKHLKKLSEHYDPNGLKNNYAVIYAKSNNFNELWSRYIDFIPTIDFSHKILRGVFDDITTQFPALAGIKLGLTRHDNNKTLLNVYHIFMNMNF
jgi:hypothetical protein